MKKAFLIGLVFLVSTVLWAAPGKPTVSGTYTHGSTNVSISGSSDNLGVSSTGYLGACTW